MPSLFIVVDEFSEMLSAKPEFIDLFVAIGRLGRSLGLHLLLASQRLEEGRLRGLESHLSYRVGLRTFSAGESRGVLGVPDAYELPAVPGLGLPQARPVHAAAVQGGVRLGARRRAGPASRRDEGGSVRGILPFTISEVQTLEPDRGGRRGRDAAAATRASRTRCSTSPSTRMVGHGPAAHQVWLPPLDVPDTLDELMPDLVERPRRSAWSRRSGAALRRPGRSRSAPSTGRASSAATR